MRPTFLVALFLPLAALGGQTGESPAGDVRLAAAARTGSDVGPLLSEGVDVNAPGAQGTPALHWAAYRDDLETARLLIGAGADVTLANRYGLVPLDLAAANGNAAMIRLFLEAGSDPNHVDPTGETVLMVAARVGKPDAVRVLLEAGAVVDTRDTEFDQTALMVAVREGHPDVVNVLLGNGADPDLQTRVGETPRWILPNSVPGFSFGIGIVRGGSPPRGRRAPIPGGLSSFHYAVREGDLESVRLLLTAGADIELREANDISPLLMAIMNAHTEVALFLIEEGADIDVSDWYGRTPLWSAIEARNQNFHNGTLEHMVDREPLLEVIEVLLERGADPNPRTAEQFPIRGHVLPITGDLSWVDFTGQTPFITAALSGDLTVMRMLLDHGADPHLETYEGTSALMAAAGVNWVVAQTFDEGPDALLEAVALCLELGLDVNRANSMGVTALMGAANRGSDEIIQLLVENGARLDAVDNEGRNPLTFAGGVFLATHAAVPKPSSVELLSRLMDEAGIAVDSSGGDR